MAVKLGIWSLTLIPGESYPMSVRKDFQITNAALGEDLKDKDGRSVVKVTHEPLPSAFFEASDSEDEYDSEIDGDLPSDEFELDSEEGFRKIDKKDRTTAANGDAAAADDEEDDEEDEDFEGDEDDDEEDDEDEDMSDLEDDELLETTVLCALTAGKIEQANLNITFTEGDVVMFEVTGDNAVHLMGNYLDQFPNEYDSDSDSEFDSDEQDDYADLDLDELSDEEDNEDVPVKGRITEVVEEAPKKVAAAIKAETKPAVQDKKRKAEVIDSPAAKADTSMTSTDGLSKNQKKKLAKKAKTDESAAAPAAAAAAAAAPAPKKENAQKAGKVRKA